MAPAVRMAAGAICPNLAQTPEVKPWRVLSKVTESLIKPVAMRALLAWERSESGVAYDPTSAEVRTDPYATYRRLRSIDPVHRMRLIDAWALTRYRDVDSTTCR